MSTTLKLSDLGKLMEISMEDYTVLHYLNEKVIRMYHYFIFENGTAFTTVSEFVGREMLYEGYDADVVLESIKLTDPTIWLSTEDAQTLKALILKNVQEAGGFLTLIEDFIGVGVQESRLGESVEVTSVREAENDSESIVVYIDVAGVSVPLMVDIYKDDLESYLEDLDKGEDLYFSIANEASEFSDVPAAEASYFISDEILSKISDLVRHPLKVAIQQFVDEQVD